VFSTIISHISSVSKNGVECPTDKPSVITIHGFHPYASCDLLNAFEGPTKKTGVTHSILPVPAEIFGSSASMKNSGLYCGGTFLL